MNTTTDTMDREQIEAELRVLYSSLSASSSSYGDWKHIKYNEYVQQGKEAPYTDEEMQLYYDERERMRVRINELRDMLDNLPEE